MVGSFGWLLVVDNDSFWIGCIFDVMLLFAVKSCCCTPCVVVFAVIIFICMVHSHTSFDVTLFVPSSPIIISPEQHVDPVIISQKVIQGVYPGVTTSELDEYVFCQVV